MIAYHHSLSPESLPGAELDRLLAEGWYRMHQTIFTTTHLYTDENFYRVHWLRYPISKIQEHASHRRIRKRNAGFHFTIENFAGVRTDHEKLFERYRSSIDFNGATSIRQCLFGEEEVDKNIYSTLIISVFDGDALIAGGYFDVGDCTGTSILHFFDPLYKSKSLGKYLILLTVDFLRSNGYLYYYPGYLVSGIDKMDYKLFIGREATQYFDAGHKRWQDFEDGIQIPETLSQNDQLELLLTFLG